MPGTFREPMRVPRERNHAQVGQAKSGRAGPGQVSPGQVSPGQVRRKTGPFGVNGSEAPSGTR